MFGEELVNNPNSLFNLAERKNGPEEQERNQQQEEAQTLSDRDTNSYEESSSYNLDDKIIGIHAADSEMEVADKALQNTDDESATKNSTHQNHYGPTININHDKVLLGQPIYGMILWYVSLQLVLFYKKILLTPTNIQFPLQLYLDGILENDLPIPPGFDHETVTR